MGSPQFNLGDDMLMTCLNYANTVFECFINSTEQPGCFPAGWKQVKARQCFQGGLLPDMSNYPGILLLRPLSK